MRIKEAFNEVKKLCPSNTHVCAQLEYFTVKEQTPVLRYGVYATYPSPRWFYSDESFQDAVNKASDYILNANKPDTTQQPNVS